MIRSTSADVMTLPVPSHFLCNSELHLEKVEVNYAGALLGWLTGCSACWLGFLHRNLQILARGTAFVQQGVLLGIWIYFVSGYRVKM